MTMTQDRRAEPAAPHARRLPRRPLVLTARAAVLVAMAAGCLGYTLADKTVTIVVDGQTRTVHTLGGSVASALRHAGVSVGAHDSVAPDLGSSLHDGSRIVVERAAQLSPLDVRLAAALPAANRSRTIPAIGPALTVRQPQQVSLVVGGLPSTLTTTDTTVAQLLADQSVLLGPYDTVSVPLDLYPVTGTTVTVTRVTRAQWLQRNKIGIPTVRVADKHLPAGTIELAHNGTLGMHYRLWGIVSDDGHVVLRKLLQQRTVAAKPRVLLYGTKPKPVVLQAVVSPPTPTGHQSTSVPRTSKGSGLDWPALAQCESGGDPRLVDGPYYGLYQFSLGTWRSVGGSGRPSDASSAEQTYRAKLLYAQQGRSPWPSCGHDL